MGTVSLFFLGWLACALLMAGLYLVQRIRQEADIVDFGWALSIGALAIFYIVQIEGYPDRELLLGLFAVTWSARLSHFLFTKRVLRVGEDSRYKALRQRWGSRAQRNFFIFFQAQAFLAAVLSIPFLVVLSNPVPSFTISDVFAGMVFVLAVGGEIVADYQLSQFVSKPENRGMVCREGLWRYSRHPNYFFEWLHWLSYVLLAWNADYFALSCISAAIMYYLLMYVTGVPAAEESSLASRGEEYRRYQRETSAFFPWFPRRITG